MSQKVWKAISINQELFPFVTPFDIWFSIFLIFLVFPQPFKDLLSSNKFVQLKYFKHILFDSWDSCYHLVVSLSIWYSADIGIQMIHFNEKMHVLFLVVIFQLYWQCIRYSWLIFFIISDHFIGKQCRLINLQLYNASKKGKNHIRHYW